MQIFLDDQLVFITSRSDSNWTNSGDITFNQRTPGSYRVRAVVDSIDPNAVVEIRNLITSNTRQVSDEVFTSGFEVFTVAPAPDLLPVSGSVTQSTLPSNESQRVSVLVRNVGVGRSKPSVASVRWTTDPQVCSGLISGSIEVPELEAASEAEVVGVINAPMDTGRYFACIAVDHLGETGQSNTANDRIVLGPFTVTDESL